MYMSETLSITEARGKLGSLARQASARCERIFLTDQGERIAAIVAVRELEDLEDALAVAQHELRIATGAEQYVSHDEAMRMAGFAE